MSRILKNRVPVVTQLNRTECGPAVSASLLRFYGRFEHVFDLAAELEPGRDGVSLSEIATLLDRRGFETRLVTLGSIHEISRLNQPVVVLWEQAHFVIVESYDGQIASIMDPASGRRTLTAEELETKASRSLLWAAPGEGFEAKRSQVLWQWRNLPIEVPWFFKRLSEVLALSLIQLIPVIGLPQLISWLIDNPGLWTQFPMRTYAGVFVAFIATFGLMLWAARVTASFVTDLGDALTTSTLAKLLRLPYSFFSSRDTGELLYRVETVDAVRDALATGIPALISSSTLIFGIAVYFLAMPGSIMWFVLPVLALCLIATAIAVRRLTTLVDEELAKGSVEATRRLDAISSIASIRIGGYEGRFMTKWSSDFAETLRVTKKRIVLESGFIIGLSTAVGQLAPVGVAIVMVQGLERGLVSPGQLVSTVALAAILFNAIPRFSGAYGELRQATRYLSRLDEITETAPERTVGKRQTLLDSSLEFQNVTFQFDSKSSPVLSNVEFAVPDGGTLAIVGESGSGKSTLAAIAATLINPTNGQVLIGGAPVEEYDLHELRTSIGYVPQDHRLLNGSIMENLSLGRAIEPSEAIRMCENLGLLELISSLPMGLETIVSDMGSNFSGGQRQRLALARALLQRPRVLILDEATAALDIHSERKVVDYLRASGITQVIIAHRLESVRHTDQCVLLDGGHVVAKGPTAEVLSTSEYFESFVTN